MPRFQFKTFRHSIKQLAGPGIAFDPLPRFMSADGLYRPDPGFTSLAAFYKGLKYVNSMENP
jgi:hypothetical protein